MSHNVCVTSEKKEKIKSTIANKLRVSKSKCIYWNNEWSSVKLCGNLSEICTEGNCELANCNKRHPKESNYYNQFQKCKFYNCSYKHFNPPNYKDIQELRYQ